MQSRCDEFGPTRDRIATAGTFKMETGRDRLWTKWSGRVRVSAAIRNSIRQWCLEFLGGDEIASLVV